jgi:hypothetical protein
MRSRADDAEDQGDERRRHADRGGPMLTRQGRQPRHWPGSRRPDRLAGQVAAQIVGEERGAWTTSPRVGRQRVVHDRREIAAQLRAQGAQRPRLGRLGGAAPPIERQSVGQQFVGDRTERPDVRGHAAARTLPPSLGAGVRERAAAGLGLAHERSEAEVDHLDLAGVRDQHVLGLQVVVDDAEGVCVGHCGGEIGDERDAPARIGADVLRVAVERLPGDEFHREPRHVVAEHRGDAGRQHAGDAGMGELA